MPDFDEFENSKEFDTAAKLYSALLEVTVDSLRIGDTWCDWLAGFGKAIDLKGEPDAGVVLTALKTVFEAR